MVHYCLRDLVWLEKGDPVLGLLYAAAHGREPLRAAACGRLVFIGQRISISLKVDARYDKEASAEEKLRSIGEL